MRSGSAVWSLGVPRAVVSVAGVPRRSRRASIFVTIGVSALAISVVVVVIIVVSRAFGLSVARGSRRRVVIRWGRRTPWGLGDATPPLLRV
jgi:hypothetical protein